MILYLNTGYNKKAKQLWTLKVNVFKAVRYINQNTSRGHFACFNLPFELYKCENSIVFEKKLLYQRNQLITDILRKN